ncbi:MAG: SWIM zinc finger family protein [Pseudoclavibacter sp.]|nr:SWIM zinc finger family protein [Pseudoclavibacter sp.]
MTTTVWSEAQVLAVAPDEASVKAARKLAGQSGWSDLGAGSGLLWGRCKGSGKNPYQVTIDLSAPAYTCSCPSRKFPCKHALALLLRWSAGGVPEAAEPADFAAEWAEARRSRAEQSEARRQRREQAPPDPAAQAKRREARLVRMDAGIEDFALWLTDLVRGGTAAAHARPASWWNDAAARLVDAQLPGLAGRVRALGAEQGRREDWAELVLRALGRWWLLVRAWRSRDRLDPDRFAELRTALGWPIPAEEVRQGGQEEAELVALGRFDFEDDRLRHRRAWYRDGDGQLLVQLDTAAPGAALPPHPPAGTRLRARIARYPGVAPRRLLLLSEPLEADRAGQAGGLGGADGVRQALTELAERLAPAPWRERHPLAVRGVRLHRDAEGRACLADRRGDALPLADEGAVLALLAQTGGAPCEVFGEFDGTALRVLASAFEGGVTSHAE